MKPIWELLKNTKHHIHRHSLIPAIKCQLVHNHGMCCTNQALRHCKMVRAHSDTWLNLFIFQAKKDLIFFMLKKKTRMLLSNKQATFIPHLPCTRHCSTFLILSDSIKTTYIRDDETKAQRVSSQMPSMLQEETRLGPTLPGYAVHACNCFVLPPMCRVYSCYTFKSLILLGL